MQTSFIINALTNSDLIVYNTIVYAKKLFLSAPTYIR